MRLLITGGGTGGGVYPALAVAAAVQARYPESSLLWVGSRTGLERDLVEREGVDFKAVSGGPIAGVGLRALLSGIQLSVGTLGALGILRRFQPDVLLTTGGWPTIPATLAARLLGVPIVFYLPDTEPAGTIKALSRFAMKVAINFHDSASYFGRGVTVETGYPLRPDLLEAAGYDVLGQPLAGQDEGAFRARARPHFNLSDDKPVLLVFGGSRGARSINRALVDQLPEIITADGAYSGCQIIHISGRLDAGWVQSQLDALSTDLRQDYHFYEYLHTHDMAQALAVADLVVARAGAGTLGEFPLFGLPAILVPYPHAWRYQKVNADVLATRGAAVRLDDDRLAGELARLVKQLITDQAARQRMARSMQELKRPDAAARIALTLHEVADAHSKDK